MPTTAKNILNVLCTSSTLFCGAVTVSAIEQVKSPDGKVMVEFLMQTGGVPAYQVEYLGKPIVLESRLGLLPDFTHGFEIARISENEHQGEWTQNYGERKVVPDNYRELNVDLQKCRAKREKAENAKNAKEH